MWAVTSGRQAADGGGGRRAADGGQRTAVVAAGPNNPAKSAVADHVQGAVIPQSGHWAPEEQSEALAQQLQGFLSSP